MLVPIAEEMFIRKIQKRDIPWVFSGADRLFVPARTRLETEVAGKSDVLPIFASRRKGKGQRCALNVWRIGGSAVSAF
jgi:hypothetical protein